MGNTPHTRVAVACQGGGSHTAFTAGVLQALLNDIPSDVEIVALSGTSGGAICAALAWEGLVRNEPQRGVAGLRDFWRKTAATDLWDQFINQALITLMSLRDRMALPEISPYQLPTWGEDHFRHILEQSFDFAELRELARRPGAPGLQIGAVEVLSGHFDLFTGEEICAECLLASAAIPDLFRAVNVPGRGMYWDGLFSQNPPIHDLVRYDLDELWVIQINSRTCARVPTAPHEIMDRRNALSGNLSLMQELKFIEAINRAIAEGSLTNPRFRPIQVERIALDRDLGYRSKLDRGWEKLEELRAYGQAKWRWFAQEREARRRFPSSNRAVAQNSGIQELLSGAGQV